MTTSALQPARGVGRWWTYQRERFPLVAHVPLIAAFSGAAVCFSAMLRGPGSVVAASSLVVAFATALLFFFQLRVADELKDAEDDARYRPYRPVPRGLVTLRELSMLGATGAAIQLALALWLTPRLVPLLLLVWAYMALMTREFFAREWLRKRPVVVILTHMPVMPLIDLYASACDWMPAGAPMAAGLRWFLIASFFNGVVVEVGRKIRAPEREEHGVETYTALWGARRAIATWLAAMSVALLCATAAAREIGAGALTIAVLGGIWLLAGVAGAAFVARPTVSRARWIEPLAGSWTLAMYIVVGILPLLLRR
ncbi:MAG: UbiA family prenyltransferase [Gemmatimonadaceae bacterium]|nr:UbiA family prenyltransferase [Gemmatimonadaceae bacterium]NUQ93946.1 UbiA family prenyltransferase [Gemmatimonadaceae bacterium]NUR20793.1 UbiA family prenyltransferase [Gemmatimonadaceae bacterium]NUS97051.1 UbiA family prenyltransferase [Gemmatimonadaceae bacterium]